MTNSLRKRRIHQSPARAVKTAVHVLSRWINPESIRLGGGTVLESRWHHRKSTDLDFFAIGDQIDELRYNRYNEIYEDLVAFGTRGTISSHGIRITGRSVIHFLINDTPVSLIPTSYFQSDPCNEIEEQTGVYLNSTSDILAKKLIHRLCYAQIATDRDAYDLLIARTFAYDELRYVWRSLDPLARPRVIEHCQYRAEGGLAQSNRSRDLSEVRYPHLVTELWDNAKRLFETDLEFQPLHTG